MTTHYKWASLCAAAVLLAGCAGTPAEPPVAGRAPVADAAAAGHRIAGLALALVGTPYRYGGADPAAGFDCSGLVFYTYTQNGIDVPRTSRAQFRESRKIALADAERGDLVFFQDQAKLSHVGIWLGHGRFVHAPASGRNVSVADFGNEYYQQHLVGVGRLLAD